MPFDWLPNPLIIRIASYLPRTDLSKLTRTNTHLYNLLTHLYTLNIQNNVFRGFYHYCNEGQVLALRRFFTSLHKMDMRAQNAWD
ncbi:hypothetical protein BDV19DRAFT_372312 [Aspergillus venezuelensis]